VKRAGSVYFSTRGECPFWKTNGVCSVAKGSYCGYEDKTAPPCDCPFEDTSENKIIGSSNYRVLDGCWNCKHVFIWSQQDEDCKYYCHKDKSERPLCDNYEESHSVYLTKIKGLRMGEDWDQYVIEVNYHGDKPRGFLS
jgi:hypothetical protein